jgi:lysophospholipase L1-like esterase
MIHQSNTAPCILMKNPAASTSRRGVLASLLAFCMASYAHADIPTLPQLQNVKRIVFLGDSITQAGDYVVDIECWLLAQGQDVEILNLGLGSETASDLTAAENESHLKKFGFGRPFVSERLQRVLSATKPDLVFACYGMNDASSLPAAASGDLRYAEAVSRLRDDVLQSGAKQVVLLTPPVRECREGEWEQNTQNRNLTRYTAWLLSMKAEGWTVVNIHTPMRRALDEKRANQPEFGFTKDGVHPGREGHWVMASCVLKQYFGANLNGITNADQMFQRNGAEIRKLVQQRQKILFDAWMTQIGHQRPGVPGGPDAPRGPSLKDAQAEASVISEKIRQLRTSDL